MSVQSDTVTNFAATATTMQKVVVKAQNRVALEIYNDASAGGSAFVAIYFGDSPDALKPTAILMPFGSYAPPSGVCMGDAIWLRWLTVDANSVAFVTTYSR